MKLRVDGFVLAMLGVVALAWVYPEPGAPGGMLRPEILNKVGIALIFFLHGAALPTAALRAGTLQWRVHLLIQACTFGLFPVVGLALWWVAPETVSHDLRIGFFYLCALPSTVSSSVAFTAAARGNVPVAVFNASLSSLIGIVLTPAWLGLVANTSEHSLPFANVVLDLVRWLLAPFAAGQLVRPLIGAFVQRHKQQISKIDRSTILLLVYTSFCASVTDGVWRREGWGIVVLTMVVSALLFAVVFWCVRSLARGMALPEADQIAAIFCGSKKSLASGVPMAQIIFAGHPGIALILLPIMLYHAFQLIVCGALASRWARRPQTSLP